MLSSFFLINCVLKTSHNILLLLFLINVQQQNCIHFNDKRLTKALTLGRSGLNCSSRIFFNSLLKSESLVKMVPWLDPLGFDTHLLHILTNGTFGDDFF